MGCQSSKSKNQNLTESEERKEKIKKMSFEKKYDFLLKEAAEKEKKKNAQGRKTSITKKNQFFRAQTCKSPLKKENSTTQFPSETSDQTSQFRKNNHLEQLQLQQNVQTYRRHQHIIRNNSPFRFSRESSPNHQIPQYNTQQSINFSPGLQQKLIQQQQCQQQQIRNKFQTQYVKNQGNLQTVSQGEICMQMGQQMYINQQIQSPPYGQDIYQQQSSNTISLQNQINMTPQQINSDASIQQQQFLNHQPSDEEIQFHLNNQILQKQQQLQQLMKMNENQNQNQQNFQQEIQTDTYIQNPGYGTQF